VGIVSPDNASTARSMRGSALSHSPCIQTFGDPFRCGRTDSNSGANSAATITCLGETMSMQCASEGPTRLVLSRAVTPPIRVMPSQIAMNSGRFGINRQTVSPLPSFSPSAQRE
jgi:hypothetical protein